MMKILAAGSICLLGISVSVGGARAAEEAIKPPQEHWSFEGMFGTFDRAALQRGFQVYNQVCSGCHSLRLLAYRNLVGIGFSEDQVKKIAAEKEVQDGPNDEGEMFGRPARPSDHFVKPFPNENAAKAANNGALPPDLSLIIMARKGGPDYVYALMTGYGDAPAGMKIAEGMNYNAYFAGHQIAMPPPLSEDAVEYADGTKASVEQMAEDVATFLTWASEPEMEQRKNLGIKVLLFLVVLTALLYAVKRQIWSRVH